MEATNPNKKSLNTKTSVPGDRAMRPEVREVFDQIEAMATEGAAIEEVVYKIMSQGVDPSTMSSALEHLGFTPDGVVELFQKIELLEKEMLAQQQQAQAPQQQTMMPEAQMGEQEMSPEELEMMAEQAGQQLMQGEAMPSMAYGGSGNRGLGPFLGNPNGIARPLYLPPVPRRANILGAAYLLDDAAGQLFGNADRNKDGLMDGTFRDWSAKRARYKGKQNLNKTFEVDYGTLDPTNYVVNFNDFAEGKIRTKDQYIKDLGDQSRLNFNPETNKYSGYLASNPLESKMIGKNQRDKNAISLSQFIDNVNSLEGYEKEFMRGAMKYEPGTGLMKEGDYYSSYGEQGLNPEQIANLRGGFRDIMLGQQGRQEQAQDFNTPAKRSIVQLPPEESSFENPDREQMFKDWALQDPVTRMTTAGRQEFNRLYPLRYGGSLPKAQFGYTDINQDPSQPNFNFSEASAAAVQNNVPEDLERMDPAYVNKKLSFSDKLGRAWRKGKHAVGLYSYPGEQEQQQEQQEIEDQRSIQLFGKTKAQAENERYRNQFERIGDEFGSYMNLSSDRNVLTDIADIGTAAANKVGLTSTAGALQNFKQGVQDFGNTTLAKGIDYINPFSIGANITAGVIGGADAAARGDGQQALNKLGTSAAIGLTKGAAGKLSGVFSKPLASRAGNVLGSNAGHFIEHQATHAGQHQLLSPLLQHAYGGYLPKAQNIGEWDPNNPFNLPDFGAMATTSYINPDTGLPWAPGLDDSSVANENNPIELDEVVVTAEGTSGLKPKPIKPFEFDFSPPTLIPPDLAKYSADAYTAATEGEGMDVQTPTVKEKGKLKNIPKKIETFIKDSPIMGAYGDVSNALVMGANLANEFFAEKEYNDYRNKMRNTTVADNIYSATIDPINQRGTFDVNTGLAEPDNLVDYYAQAMYGKEMYKSGGQFKPHMMYDPKTKKAYKASKPEDHERMAKMGYTHELPKAQWGITDFLNSVNSSLGGSDDYWNEDRSITDAITDGANAINSGLGGSDNYWDKDRSFLEVVSDSADALDKINANSKGLLNNINAALGGSDSYWTGWLGGQEGWIPDELTFNKPTKRQLQTLGAVLTSPKNWQAGPSPLQAMLKVADVPGGDLLYNMIDPFGISQYSHLPNYNQYNTFDEAFAAARNDLGRGASFMYGDTRYTTNYEGEAPNDETQAVLDYVTEGLSPEQKERLMEVYKKAGQPPISFEKDTDKYSLPIYGSSSWVDVASGSDQRRPHVNLLGRDNPVYINKKSTIPYTRNLLLDELSHNMQIRNDGTGTSLWRFGTDAALGKLFGHDPYHKEGAFEHEAHEKIQPLLLEYVNQGGTFPDLGFANGGELEVDNDTLAALIAAGADIEML